MTPDYQLYELVGGKLDGASVVVGAPFFHDPNTNLVYSRPRYAKDKRLYCVRDWLLKHTPPEASIVEEHTASQLWLTRVIEESHRCGCVLTASRNIEIPICPIRHSMHHALIRAGQSITPTTQHHG